jgi:ABC-2 type transport system ATP-binding protein
MDIIEIANVTKSFGKHIAVNDLTLHVPRGTIYGFIGPNGSGKTTTLRMIMGIFYPDNGSIRVFGSSLKGSCSDRIGYLPEERGLYKNMKVHEILRFYAGLKKPDNFKDDINYWLDKFELKAWANKKVDSLSKGMSQKVQFIASVITKPELLILDEPFTGLDPVNVDLIRDSILDFRKNGTTIIFSTHDMSVAEKMCDFIFMIFKGRKVLDGTLDSIQEKYHNDTIRIRTSNGSPDLSEIAGIEQVRNFGRIQELRLTRGTDPHDIMQRIMARNKIQSFELTRPSLHDIFVRIAGPEAAEVNNA